MSETEPTTNTDVSRLLSTVFGNGKPGLDEEVRTLKRDRDDYKERLEKLESLLAKGTRTLLLAGASATFALLWQVIVWYIQEIKPTP